MPFLRTHRSAATVDGEAAAVALTIARMIRLAASVVALIMVLGIAFFVLGARPSNTVVSHVHDWAKTLAGPFDGMFHLHSAKGTLAINWGIAIVVWLLVASLLVRIVLTPAWLLRRRSPATVDPA